jgi:hypothetical protein
MSDYSDPCQCYRCITGRGDEVGGWPVTSCRMILCPTCGCKRCPHSTDHRLACTDSNAPGQPGSRYGGLASSHSPDESQP